MRARESERLFPIAFGGPSADIPTNLAERSFTNDTLFLTENPLPTQSYQFPDAHSGELFLPPAAYTRRRLSVLSAPCETLIGPEVPGNAPAAIVDADDHRLSPGTSDRPAPRPPPSLSQHIAARPAASASPSSWSRLGYILTRGRAKRRLFRREDQPTPVWMGPGQQFPALAES